MRKKEYINPEFDILKLSVYDIICASAEGNPAQVVIEDDNEELEGGLE